MRMRRQHCKMWLVRSEEGVRRPTYKDPKPKAAVIPIFSRFASVRPQIGGMGMSRMIRSVKIVDAAFAIHVATWLMHLPGISGYHIF